MRVDAESSKAQLRKRIRSERAARAAAEAESSGAEYVSSIAESAWQVVKSLRPDLDLTGCSMLAYAALAGEPDLDPTIDRFLAHGGTVYLPVVTSVGHALMFGAVTGSMSTLEPRGKWGIREPSPSLTASALLAAEVAPDLIFVPALGFGPGGARLGNGGGFYDRTFGPQGEVPLVGAVGEEPLAGPQGEVPLTDGTRTDGERTEPASVYGVCFSSELNLPGLTIEPWDLQISQAVTDHGVHTLD
ncbi:5-formyltetrahydrofolate cyclo-ligase [Brevibacterium sp. BDJS002]|uniref:5-formyltetrahydrofolate cyclo-ligase n=1 Tax=Brevibacterium sp. BDJS002 TaxID=3020906 RepID=UPI002307B558|nr:5-formyltetrahydrofolate cyclo-ligase [Brevibacterium sp. BDJS002]WCE39483.1 5-formyltetrahydrofolate cyclo-ligase [Brevibacterium sp. BDJS002]